MFIQWELQVVVKDCNDNTILTVLKSHSQAAMATVQTFVNISNTEPSLTPKELYPNNSKQPNLCSTRNGLQPLHCQTITDILTKANNQTYTQQHGQNISDTDNKATKENENGWASLSQAKWQQHNLHWIQCTHCTISLINHASQPVEKSGKRACIESCEAVHDNRGQVQACGCGLA